MTKQNHSKFALIPEQFWQDRRLKQNHLKVLACLLSYTSKEKMTVWPKRQTLSDQTGIRLTTISIVTSELENFGWLKKTGKGGFSSPSKYEITVPESCTVLETRTVRETRTTTVPETRTTTVLETCTGKEVSSEVSSEVSNIYRITLRDNSVYEILPNDLSLWKAAYKKISVDEEILAMISWTESNPAKRKTKGGIKRFINSWLSRANKQTSGDIDMDSTDWAKNITSLDGRKYNV